jgi:hypothetical protein
MIRLLKRRWKTGKRMGISRVLKFYVLEFIGSSRYLKFLNNPEGVKYE